MVNLPEALDVFIVAGANEPDVVYASHPTESRTPGYKPRLRRNYSVDSVSSPSDRKAHLGRVRLQEDGTYVAHLTGDIGQAMHLIIQVAQVSKE